MAASAEVRYQWTDTEIIEVTVQSDSNSPDVMDDIVHRADDLLARSIATVNAAAEAARETT